MAKISDLSDGGSLLPTDDLVAVRSGANVKVKADNITVDRIDLGDNEKIRLGDSQDLEIYHSASDSIINDNGTGSLKLQQGGSTKLEVTTTGIDVTGVITTDGMTTSADINFGDNDKAVFGAGSDLQIYHDGSNSYIQDEGTGGLIISSDGPAVYIQKGTTETSAEFNTDGAVKLRYDNVTKFQTTSTGIDVTGTVTADGLTVDGNATISVSDNSDNLTLVSTDTDANAGPNLLFKRDNNSAAGDDLMGSIVFQGEDAGNNLTDYVAFKTQIQDPTGGSEDGRLKIELMSGGTSRSLLDASGSNAIVFNEDGQALNFRVESSGDSNMLFVDGTNDRVGISTSSPDSLLELETAVTNSTGGLLLTNTNASGYSTVQFKNTGGTAQTYTMALGGSSSAFAQKLYIYDDTDGAARVVLDHSGNVGINETNPQFKLDVENVGGDAIRINAGADFSGLRLTSTAGEWSVRTASDALIFYDVTSASEVGRFDSSGNLGIGRSNPSSYVTDANSLYVKGQIRVDGVTNSAATPALLLDDSNSGLFAGASNEVSISTTGSERLRIGSSGHASLITGGAALQWQNGKQTITGASDSNDLTYRTYEDHIWKTGTSVSSTTDGTERMRIDSSGRLLVGKSVIDFGTEGLRFDPNHIEVTTDNATTAYFNRLNGDGTLLEFYRGSSTVVGSIGTDTSNSDLYIGNGDTAIMFHDGVDAIFPHNASTNASRDAAIDIGYSTYRFKDLYLSGDAYVGQVKFPSVSYDDRSLGIDSTGFYLYNNDDSRYDLVVDGSGSLLVGKSTTAVGTAGTNLAGTSIVISAGSGNTYHVYDTTASNYPFVVTYQGAVTCLSVTETSDERLKKNITDLPVGLEEIKQLRPVQFDWKDEDLDNGVFGFIAQEIEQTLPSLVTEEIYKENGETRKAIKKNEITAILVKAIQEQQDLIESLTARIAALEGAN